LVHAPLCVAGKAWAALAVFLFLRNVRTTLISAVALPVSVIATFALLRAFDFTFNNMTMLALTLSVGLLIDDAIIVIENIYRHVEDGMPPREAAAFATSEIGLAVMATTLAIIVIFLPVAFMKGIIGRFFLQFALTVVFSVAVSLIVSFTMTPMLASLYLKQLHRSKNSPEPPATGRFAGWKTKLACCWHSVCSSSACSSPALSGRNLSRRRTRASFSSVWKPPSTTRSIAPMRCSGRPRT
jgi:multidrug efflux pump subunit AcrB